MKCMKCLWILLPLLAVTTLALPACSKKSPSPPNHDDHAHHHKSPIKDGWLFHEPNETHHVRLKIDAENKSARALMLDKEAKEIQPIAAKSIKLSVLNAKPVLQIVLEAQPDKDDPKDKCSVFIGKHDHLAGKLDRKELEITAEIDGKTIHFKYDADDEHGKK